MLIYELRGQEEKIRQGQSEGPIVALADALLYQAIACGASDIHLEPTAQDMRVRFRIDGMLHSQEPISYAQRFLVLSRLKVLAALDIAQHRKPQDGKLRIVIPDAQEDKSIDVRVATFPSIYGEKMVIRILDRSATCIALDQLGFAEQMQEAMRHIVSLNQGFFLVTGPTGCGKTTTLYSLLSLLDTKRRNVVTMEDPVEYHIEGVTQSQINVQAGFTFENGLRSILRQDPDVVMIGEIRDRETVHIATEAALTGHLVLSTLHTNDAASVITRLLEMGIEPYLINAAVTGIVAQRLTRRLCESCKRPVKVLQRDREMLERYGCMVYELFEAPGCRHCFNLGCKGRVAIGELLLMTDQLRDAIMARASLHEIKKLLAESGMASMEQDALHKLQGGIISLEEFIRVIG